MADRVVQALEAGDFIEMTSNRSVLTSNRCDLTSNRCDLTLFCGDFNTEPGDLPHQVLTGLYRLQDSHQASSPLKTHYLKENSFTEPEINRSITIDYILHKPVNLRKSNSKTISLEIPLKNRIPNLVTRLVAFSKGVSGGKTSFCQF